jgi:D-alanyl-D-alanine carboxypeptidase/D-alanyl-D-alanine-endopeptidase (penicillin-binding protein 4)
MAGPWTPIAVATDVSGRIDAILHGKGLSGPGTGVFVWDLHTGLRVYSLHPSTPLTPASNMKLVTSAAALLSWGQAHRIPTQILTTGDVSEKGVLTGDLFLRGFGDPSFSGLRYQRKELQLRTSSVEGFVRRLKAKGVRRVDGGVVADDSWFDRHRVVATWKASLQDECGRLTALSANEGLRNGNRLHSPALHAAQLVTSALRKAGIKVRGRPRLGATPTAALLLGRQWSASLPQLLRRLNKDSDNFFAEVLLKGLGRDLFDEGSTDAGLQVSRDVMAQIGARPNEYRLADGSGLSYENRLTAGDVVRLLVAMYRRDDWKVYYDSLAVAGRDGTLEERMEHTAAAGNAHAKTGSLAIAASLSGYVTAANGHRLAFAILSNGDDLDYWRTTKAHDAIVATLAASRPGGEDRLRSTPDARQHVRGATGAHHTSGRALVPCVEVSAP